MKGGLRLRLTLWNLLVVAGAALLLGVGLVVENQRRAYERVDRDLWERARAAIQGPVPGNEPRFDGFRRGPGGPPGGEPPMPFGQEFGGGPGPGLGGRGFGRGPGGPGTGGPGVGGPGPRGQGPGGPPNGPDDPFFRLRRAQYISQSGAVIRPAEDKEPYDVEGVRLGLKDGKAERTIDYEGSKVRVLTLRRPDGGVVQVARELRDVEQFESSLAQTFLWTLPVVLLAGAFGALFLANRALKPVSRLAKTAELISAQDLSQRLPVEGNDEFSELGGTVNRMIGRLESSFHELEGVVENQRRFTADASHELRTPLTRLQLAASAALERDDPAAMREALEVADRAAAEMSQLVQQLLTLSRADAGALKLTVTDLDLREPIVMALDDLPEASRIVVDIGDAPCMVRGDAGAMRRIAVNLLRNAITYAPEPAQIRLKVSGSALVVSDSGPGIAPADMARLGERFYRVDAARTAGVGNGLGLAIVNALAEAQGASLKIQSEVGKGSEFRVEFEPATQDS